MSMLPIQAFDPHFTRGFDYHTPQRQPGMLSRLMPNWSFYLQMLLPVTHLCLAAQRGKSNDVTWVLDSARVARALERVGCPIHVEGMEHFSHLDSPCVFVANHMSTLETFVLPSIIRPRRPVTFVVKESLVRMPLFGAVMRSREPVVVGRVSPREDLARVLEEGTARLNKGISIIIFPQSTRSRTFEPSKFNSIGIKLARRAGVPIIPVALLTDAWGPGRRIKDFGPIHPGRHVYFRFAPPLHIRDQGKAEHAHICEFITNALTEWDRAEAHL